MGLNTEIFNNISTFLIGLGIAFFIALWISLIIWVYRDIQSRSDDLLIRIMAVIISILLFLPGVLIYLILRPQNTLEEKYQKALEEEAFLATLEEAGLCPGCERKIHNNWIVCPSCHSILKKKCPGCNTLLELAWDICPFCSLELSPQKRGHPAADGQ